MFCGGVHCLVVKSLIEPGGAALLYCGFLFVLDFAVTLFQQIAAGYACMLPVSDVDRKASGRTLNFRLAPIAE